ncbi:MAG TPA: 6,7-dimethyl-8-ribityllumazine synthase [Phenylobacterium sp.]|nr:6,7-dimethyl-8-ribityllumazine synthase [Phenylobacterium sp.]
MTQASYELKTANGAYRPARIAFVQSGWHSEIVDKAREGFVAEMATLGFPEKMIDVFQTPGAFEIPLHAQTLARTARYAAVVAAGFVVDGGIYRHEFVAETVIRALMQVQLETEIPIFSVVLTPHHFHDHEVHHRFFKDHFVHKGAEAAQACAQTLESLHRLTGAA